MEKECKLHFIHSAKSHSAFLDCIFEVCPKYKYDAMKVHQDFLERFGRKKDWRHTKSNQYVFHFTIFPISQFNKN